MDTVPQRPDTGERPDGPRVTPYFTAQLEAACARAGLPPEAA